jgi:flagellar biosynthesis protein FlhG
VAEQADSLRRWVHARADTVTSELLRGRMAGPHVLAVTSGKGGVGKSNLALNLALALQSRGVRTAVLDADLGLANINIILGQEPGATVFDVMQGERRLRDVLQPGPLGIVIIPGASGMAEAAAADVDQVRTVMAEFGDLDAVVDWLLVDTGAGISPAVLAFVAAADEALVVTTPEPTALADAYGLIKAVDDMMSPVRLHLVVNRAPDPARGQRTGERLASLVARAHSRSVAVAGVMVEDSAVGRSVVRQEPFYIGAPKSGIKEDVDRLADYLLDRVPAPRRGGISGFVRRVMSVLPGMATPEATPAQPAVRPPGGIAHPVSARREETLA